MLTPFVRGSLIAVVALVAFGGPSLAQQQSREDSAIEQIRGRASMSSTDQRQIRDWVAAKVAESEKGSAGDLASVSAFRALFKKQYEDTSNTTDFKNQLVVQTAAVAVEGFGDAKLPGMVGRSLATVLLDFERLETVDALLAGLSVKDAGTRVLCLRGLADLRGKIGGDDAMVKRIAQRLQTIGLTETDDEVLRQVYLVLSYPNQVPAVFDIYMALLDKRLAIRRGPGIFLGSAEVELIKYFRLPAVMNALSADQKSQLAGRLAVVFRQDAERYAAEKIGYYEKDGIERRLDGIEAIFEDLVGRGKGADVRGLLEAGGHQKRAAILQEAYKWVGDPKGPTSGVLNAAPWNVPVGAP